MANETILPDSVAKAPHVRALDEMAASRFADIDLGVVMVNLIDTAPAAALPFLGAQFNLSGYKGWKFADTEQKQRDLIKKAIELHRYKGTPYGIKEALKLAGVLGEIIIRERVTLTYDGSLKHNSVGYYGNHWAFFRVLIDVANIGGLALDDIRGVIKEYKNVRSWLIDVSYYTTMEDTVAVGEEITQAYGIIETDRVEGSDSLANNVI